MGDAAASSGAESQGSTVVWWIRRDMRLDDNPALTAALNTGSSVVPVFVWSPEDDGQFQQGRYSRWWTKNTVKLFQGQLEHMGSRLIIRRASETTKGLLQVVQETKASAVFFNTLYDPISLVRDHEVKNALSKLGIPCSSFNADVLYEPWEVLDLKKEPYTNFQAFWSGVLSMPTPPALPLRPPTTLPRVNPDLFSVEVNDVDWFFTPEQEASSDQLKFKWRPGVLGAVEKMEYFLSDRLAIYHEDKAKVDRASTSQLSPWIHSGTLSIRYLFYRVCQRQAEMAARGDPASASIDGFLKQLGYREYSRYLSYHFPFIHERSLMSHLRAVPWRMDQRHFKAWRQGQTGYPLVDAAMRELWSTGWTHNRMRVVTSSFMVKNLLLPWQWGLKYFWDAQMDADLECDALGWQYVSGAMTDAHPFSYMIDLEVESTRFDPDGEYVRRWLPVLARLPIKYIHAPWKAPIEVLTMADVELGFNYPDRIITVEESKANLNRAVAVLDAAAATSSSGTRTHPYRAPTAPLSNTQNIYKGQSGSGAPGTGTGTAYAGSWPVAAGTNTGSAVPAAAGVGAAAVNAPRGVVVARVQHGQQVDAAMSHYAALPLSKAGRAQRREAERAQRAVVGVQRLEAAVVPGGEWLGEEVEEGDGADGMEGGGEREEYSEGTDSMSEDDRESEEVVSNTINLSADQPNAWSTLPVRQTAGHEEEKDNDAEASSQPTMRHHTQQQPNSVNGVREHRDGGRLGAGVGSGNMEVDDGGLEGGGDHEGHTNGQVSQEAQNGTTQAQQQQQQQGHKRQRSGTDQGSLCQLNWNHTA